jgi:hypothetical protein
MFSSRSLITAVLVGFAAVVGCASPTGEPVDSSDSEVTQAGQIVGSISANETKTGAYSGPALAYTFTALNNDAVTVDVSIGSADAVAWITDANFNVLATSPTGNTGDTHVSFNLAPGPTRSLRVVFKDRSGAAGTYNVKLNVAPGSCDPSHEPWFNYKFPEDQCGDVHYSCPPNKLQFNTSCGCGCET